jgi:hypothetical protein
MATINGISAWLTDINNLPINDVKNKPSLLQAQIIPAAEVVAKMKRIERIDDEL